MLKDGTFRFTQNSIYTRTKQFPETKLSQQADIGFDYYTLLHCVWERLTGPKRAEWEHTLLFLLESGINLPKPNSSFVCKAENLNQTSKFVLIYLATNYSTITK